MHIYADFNNRDADGCLRLNNAGTVNDLAEKSIVLTEGTRLVVSDGDLMAEIVVRSPCREGVWRGEIIGAPTEMK
ncbi:MAG: hypothetical protein WC213_01240 [Arenimonas sp.]|jgi:hypothetical protein